MVSLENLPGQTSPPEGGSLFDFMADVIRENVRKSMESSAAAQTISQINQRRENLPGQLDPSDPVRLLQRWSQFAPTAPPGALLSAAKAGISADSDVGQWLVNQAVPALSEQSSKPQDYTKAMTLLTDPTFLNGAKNMSLSDTTKFLSNATLANMQSPDQSSQSDVIGNALSQHLQTAAGPDQSSFGGVLGGATDDIKTGLREAGVVGISGAQAISAGIRQQAGGLAKSISDVVQGESPTAGKTAGGVPLDPQHFTTPKFHVPGIADIPGLNQIPGIKQSPYLQGTPAGGSDIQFGGQKALTDIAGQTTLGQQLRGNDVGTGFFPGGKATEQANLAQKAAATVNGHALTPGRAFAGFVTEPDTMASNLVSGLIDLQISLHGDPANLLATELSDVHKASKLFAPTSADALDAAAQSVVHQGIDNLQTVREWAGALPTKDGQVPDLLSAVRDKLAINPDLTGLAAAGVDAHQVMKDIGSPYVGVFSGLRRYVSQPDALTYMNSNKGDEVVNKLGSMGFTDIRRYLGKDVPVDVVAQLAQTKDPAEIRSILGEAIGTSVRTTPHDGVVQGAFNFAHDHAPRLTGFLPNGSVSHLDLNNAIEQSQRTMAEVGLPKELQDPILTKIASATTKAQFEQSYIQTMGNAVANQLMAPRSQGGYGLPKDWARRLTKFWPQNTASDGKFWVDEVSNIPYVSGLSVDGEAIPLNGPTLNSELAQSIPTLNGRDLKRAASQLGRLYTTAGGENLTAEQRDNIFKYVTARGLQGVDYLAGTYTKAFKIGVLTRLGLGVRVVAEAQARMAAGGLASIADPLDYVAWTIGHKGETALDGTNLMDTLGDQASAFGRDIGKSNYINDTGIWSTNEQMAKHWVPIRSNDPKAFIPAWGDELSKLHMNKVSQLAAQAIEDPANFTAPGIEGKAGIDALKEWFATGEGQRYKQDLIDANLMDTNGKPWSVNLVNRVNSDGFIDNVVVPRILQNTASNPTLLDAVAHGTPFNENGVGVDFIQQLKDLHSTGIAPQYVMGRKPQTAGQLKLASAVIGHFFNAFVDVPYRTMAKSPTWKQFYWKEGERLLPFMTAEAQDQVIESARAAEINLTKPAIAGGLGLADAQKLANLRASVESRNLLHYVTERNNMMDTLRYVLPFGDAFRNVVTQWVKIAAENPQVARRVQQGVQEMRSSGFFYPQTDANGNTQESFTMVPGAITKYFTGADFKMSAPVSGLNLASQGLPGIGPAVSLPASLILPKNNPLADKAMHYIAPYGPPDIKGGIVESLFPGWADKLRIGGWLGPVGRSADQQVTLNDLAKQVFSYKASTGHYDLSNPNILAQVSADSLQSAKKLFLLRGLAQFASPSAPNFVPRVLADDRTKKLADGGYIETWKLGQDYQKMIQSTGDSYTATLQFINKYGPNYIFATQPENQRLVYGVPTTADALAFKYAHPDVVRNYKNVYGYFAPQGGPFDYQAYLDAIHSGTIKPLDVQTWAMLANARLGNAVYSNLRSRIGASPTTDQASWLADNKAAIAKEFPGFGDESIKASKQKLDGAGGTVDELRRAVQDPALKGTDLAHAAAVYLELRDRALAEARSRTGKSTTSLSGNAMADLRGWLYQNGTIIATKIPDFTTMWNDLFLNEVAPPTDPSLGATDPSLAATGG